MGDASWSDTPDDDRFEQGRELGRREGYARAFREWTRTDVPFAGVPEVPLVTCGAQYVFRRSHFDSCVAYERKLIDVVRDLQHARALEQRQERHRFEDLETVEQFVASVPERLRAVSPLRRWWLRRTRPWETELANARADLQLSRRRLELLRQLQREITSGELWQVRVAVDTQLAEGHGRRCVIEALRETPNRPDGVTELSSIEAFVSGDMCRALPDWPLRRDAGGADYGYEWRLENPLRRWETTRWRVSWLGGSDETHEVYAVERLESNGNGGRRTGRVWLLGRVDDERVLRKAILELELHAQGERNSLVAVAKAVRRAG